MAKTQAEDTVTHMELLEADHGFGLGSSMRRLDLVFLFFSGAGNTFSFSH